MSNKWIEAWEPKTGLYGITGSNYQYTNDPDSIVLLYYDPMTGSNTTVFEESSSFVVSMNNFGCLDPINNIYYFLGYFWSQQSNGPLTLYGYNLTNPTSIFNTSNINVELPMFASQGLQTDQDACIANPNTGDMYVL